MTALTIFLHGLGASSSAWNKFFNVINSDEDTSSIQEYVEGMSELDDDIYYYLYNYKSEIVSNGNLATKVKESISGKKIAGNVTIDSHVGSLKSFINFHSGNFDVINIVAHSLGGVLTMKLLLTLNYELVNKLGSVLLYGSPLKGSESPSDLVKYLGSSIPTAVLKELSPDSETILKLNKEIDGNIDFLKSNFNIFYVKGDSDNRIIEVTEDYFERFGKMESVQGGHSDIKEPADCNDLAFQCFKNFIFNDTKEKILQENEIKNKAKKIKNVKFSGEFSGFLQNVEFITNAHPNKKEVILDDIYVYPKIEKYYDIKSSERSVSAKNVIDKLAPSKLLIAGEGQSGKTSLCKKIMLDLREKGFFPIYLSDEKNLYEGRIESRLADAFKGQYVGCLFDDLPTEKIIPILDNFYVAKKKERHIEDLGKYSSVILIVDDLFSLDLAKDNLLNEYNHYKIKEYSPTLRNEIIEKWMSLSDGGVSSNDEYKILDKKSELVENSLGKMIGSGVMPAYPFFILTIISTSEILEKPLNEEITSQGHCYQALIYLYLRKQNVKDEDFGTYINFLTEFAYFFYKEGKSEISKDEFNTFFKIYEKQYNLPVAKDILLKKLNKIQIIQLDSFNNYSFGYPYLYYFFVAKYIAENTDGETDEVIDDLISNLHKNENAYILTFMSHHSKNNSLLDKLLLSANNLYESHEPSKLCAKELAFFDERVNELVEAVLPNGDTCAKQERLSKLKEQDEREESSELNQEDEGEIEDNEYYLTLRKSIKTVEVMGHIIKNRSGSLKRKKLEEIFSSAMDVNLRITREFTSLIEKEENQKEVLKFLEGRVYEVMKSSGRTDFSKEEVSKITVKFFWNMNFFLISTLINKTIRSLGSDRLIDIVNVVCEQKNTPASFLINHGILMWYKKNVKIDDIVKRINKNDFSPTSKRILDFMVMNHCLLHNVKAKDLQKIENKLDISAKKLKAPSKLMNKIK